MFSLRHKSFINKLYFMSTHMKTFELTSTPLFETMPHQFYLLEFIVPIVLEYIFSIYYAP